MDCAPLNLAHFHERRSERFLRHHRYEEAIKALETSLIYLQDAYKNVTLPKSREVLNTQKWDFERKLRQIELRKTQHGLTKVREFVPLKETSPMIPLRPEHSGSAQSVAKAIDKTVQDFDAKFPSTPEKTTKSETQLPNETTAHSTVIAGKQENHEQSQHEQRVIKHDMPSLAPLELPAFDFAMFSSSSAPSLTTFTSTTDDFQE